MNHKELVAVIAVLTFILSIGVVSARIYEGSGHGHGGTDSTSYCYSKPKITGNLEGVKSITLVKDKDPGAGIEMSCSVQDNGKFCCKNALGSGKKYDLYLNTEKGERIHVGTITIPESPGNSNDHEGDKVSIQFNSEDGKRTFLTIRCTKLGCENPLASGYVLQDDDEVVWASDQEIKPEVTFALPSRVVVISKVGGCTPIEESEIMFSIGNSDKIFGNIFFDSSNGKLTEFPVGGSLTEGFLDTFDVLPAKMGFKCANGDPVYKYIIGKSFKVKILPVAEIVGTDGQSPINWTVEKSEVPYISLSGKRTYDNRIKINSGEEYVFDNDTKISFWEIYKKTYDRIKQNLKESGHANIKINYVNMIPLNSNGETVIHINAPLRSDVEVCGKNVKEGKIVCDDPEKITFKVKKGENVSRVDCEIDGTRHEGCVGAKDTIVNHLVQGMPVKMKVLEYVADDCIGFNIFGHRVNLRCDEYLYGVGTVNIYPTVKTEVHIVPDKDVCYKSVKIIAKTTGSDSILLKYGNENKLLYTIAQGGWPVEKEYKVYCAPAKIKSVDVSDGEIKLHIPLTRESEPTQNVDEIKITTESGSGEASAHVGKWLDAIDLSSSKATKKVSNGQALSVAKNSPDVIEINVMDDGTQSYAEQTYVIKNVYAECGNEHVLDAHECILEKKYDVQGLVHAKLSLKVSIPCLVSKCNGDTTGIIVTPEVTNTSTDNAVKAYDIIIRIKRETDSQRNQRINWDSKVEKIPLFKKYPENFKYGSEKGIVEIRLGSEGSTQEAMAVKKEDGDKSVAELLLEHYWIPAPGANNLKMTVKIGDWTSEEYVLEKGWNDDVGINVTVDRKGRKEKYFVRCSGSCPSCKIYSLQGCQKNGNWLKCGTRQEVRLNQMYDLQDSTYVVALCKDGEKVIKVQ